MTAAVFYFVRCDLLTSTRHLTLITIPPIRRRNRITSWTRAFVAAIGVYTTLFPRTDVYIFMDFAFVYVWKRKLNRVKQKVDRLIALSRIN